MRYRLRTLLILGALAPPLLSLAWFGTVWVANNSEFRHDLENYAMNAGMLLAMGLVVFSALAPPYFAKEPVTLPPRYLIALWCCQVLALWPFVTLISIGVGWMFIWGDNMPRSIMIYAWPFSALVSTGLASIATLRITLTAVTGLYIVFVLSLTGTLAILAGLFWIFLVLG